MNSEYRVNAYELNQIVMYAVRGECDSRTATFSIVEASGVVAATSNAVVQDLMLNLTDYSAKLYASLSDGTLVYCDGTIEDAQNGVVSFLLSAAFMAVPGKASCTIVLTKADTNLRITGIALNVQESSIESTVLSAYRGTSFGVEILLLNPDDTVYTLTSGEVLHLKVKASLNSETILTDKTATVSDKTSNDTYVITFAPEDTASLNAGTYYYHIGLQSGEEYYIVIPPSKLLLNQL